jgi:hypothetical protein
MTALRLSSRLHHDVTFAFRLLLWSPVILLSRIDRWLWARDEPRAVAPISDHPPRYRIEREASEERAWQQLVNVLRRLAGLRINRTGQQAHDEYFSGWAAWPGADEYDATAEDRR